MLEGQVFKVTPVLEGYRVDRFLRSIFPELPGKSVRYAIEGGEVFISGEKAAKGRILREGEEVAVRRIAERADWLPVPGDLPGAAVLYSDEDVAVLSKPENVHTEPQRPLERKTLAGYLRWRFPEAEAISKEPGLTLLTRLDYATSGAVPAAVSARAFAFLAREREMGRIEKTYVCLVSGSMESDMSLSFLLSSSGGERVRARTDQREPDPLYWTDVHPVRVAGGFTLVRAVISKGKRHQIRAHLAAAGFPIVGDRRYGTVPAEGPGKTRLMLHAAEVRFAHPVSGETVSVSAPIPEAFEVI